LKSEDDRSNDSINGHWVQIPFPTLNLINASNLVSGVNIKHAPSVNINNLFNLNNKIGINNNISQMCFITYNRTSWVKVGPFRRPDILESLVFIHLNALHASNKAIYVEHLPPIVLCYNPTSHNIYQFLTIPTVGNWIPDSIYTTSFPLRRAYLISITL
jgi:hypothetical protein